MQGFNCRIMKILHDQISKISREYIRVELVNKTSREYIRVDKILREYIRVHTFSS
jgi:hypothetical protein